MIQFKEFYLDNGLQALVHEDPRSTMACMNLLYKVGSRNEDPGKTGFAHLFEHLMFGGSKHIENFDTPLQMVGGDNNAFTSTDITNYYITVPKDNIETAFWLESDRMLSLSFDPEVLEVQRKVVLEEFKQRYLNQPYGDIWHLLRPEAYKVHPYRWPTIGKELSHIEEATMDQVKTFFGQFYVPDNAILVLAGAVTVTQVEQLANKWFGPIPKGNFTKPDIPIEPAQKSSRHLEVEAQVPSNALYYTYHMPGRMQKAYHGADLLSNILGRGKSSYLFKELVKERNLFSNISGYITGSADPGLFVISGRLRDNIGFEQAEEGIKQVVDAVLSGGITDQDLERVQNQAEASSVYGELEILNRAMSLAYGAFLGNPNLANEELDIIRAITKKDISDIANTILIEGNRTSLHYKSKAA